MSPHMMVGGVLALGLASGVFAYPNDSIQRIIIDGKRMGADPITVFRELDRGPYALQTDYFTNDAELLVQTWAWGFLWPITRKGVAAAMHDVRCNPMTAAFRSTTSVSSVNDKWLAAEQVVRSMQAATRKNPRVNDKIAVVWADWGSSTYRVIASVGSITLDENPVSEEPSATPGVISPNALCPHAT